MEGVGLQKNLSKLGTFLIANGLPPCLGKGNHLNDQTVDLQFIGGSVVESS